MAGLIYRLRSYSIEKCKGENKSYTNSYYNTRWFNSKKNLDKVFNEECSIIKNKVSIRYINQEFLGGRVILEVMTPDSDGELIFNDKVLKEKLFGDSIII